MKEVKKEDSEEELNIKVDAVKLEEDLDKEMKIRTKIFTRRSWFREY